MNKERIFSGIQPSGSLHLGNYLGAIKNWVKLQNDYDSIFCIVDLHAITVPQDPQELTRKTLDIAKLYLASGIDPKKSILFIQSQVSEHSELMWLLNTIAKKGDLNKMTQLKNKVGLNNKLSEKNHVKNMDGLLNKLIYARANKSFWEKDQEEIIKLIDLAMHGYAELYTEKYISEKVSSSLVDYPVLMAADILLYNTNLVPVGEDQFQHIELTRKLGRKFNQQFGETFVLPEGFTKKETQRIMGLDDPTKKMSKSASSEYNWIGILDSPETITRKIMKAITDSQAGIEYSDTKPALKNLINIFSGVTEKTPEEIALDFKNQGYKEFKEALAQAIIDYLQPIQEKYNQISDDEIKMILAKGAKQAKALASEKIREVKNKMGIIV